MAIDLTTEQAIQIHLLNPTATCLAYREGQWKAIKREEAQIDEGFFQRFFGPASPTTMEEIESTNLCFENKSIEHLHRPYFAEIINQIKSLSARAFGRAESDEGFEVTLSFSETLLDNLNMLKQLIRENPSENYSAYIAEYRSQFNGIERNDPRYEECKILLGSIERMINPRRQAEPAIPAPAAAVEAPVDEAREMRHAVIARMRARSTDIREGIAKINREIELLREQRLQETLQQIAGASRPLGQASTQFEHTVPSFRVYDKDPGRALEIFNETADLANAVTAQRAYETKYDSLRQLVETLETAIREASAFRDQMLQNPHEFSDDLQVTQSINRLGRDIDALQANLDLLNGEYSTQVRETSSFTKIKERYEKRQEILHQATAALNAYTGPAPILISIENGQLKVEKKPFSVFGQPKGVELMTLPNGMTFAIKQDSRDDLTKLFNLALSPVSRDNPASTRFLEGHRQDFESALQRKLSK